jgi:sensor c-di-GMP phosphodiesterase-like protein
VQDGCADPHAVDADRDIVGQAAERELAWIAGCGRQIEGQRVARREIGIKCAGRVGLPGADRRRSQIVDPERGVDVPDDFGTGYASLSYLKKFPLDGLKIDRTFVFELLSDSGDAAIVGSTVALSRQLGLSVIAEGIENRATADLLISMGCEEGQGYFFGRPVPARAFESQFLAVSQAVDAPGAGRAA